MILTVGTLISDALSLAGAVAGDEIPTPGESQLALRVANVMLGSWSASRTLMRSTAPIDFVMTAGKFKYTIGQVGCDITQVTPTGIFSAYYTDQGKIDTGIELVSLEMYNSLSDKDVSTGPPMYMAFDPGDTQQTTKKGTLYVYMMPDSAYPTHLEADTYITEFVNLSDNVIFDRVYYEALIYGLAVRLFRHFHGVSVQVPADLLAIASHSLDKLKALNAVIPRMTSDLPGKRGAYNIYVDGPPQ